MSQAGLDPVADMAHHSRFEQIFATPVFSHVLKNVEALNAALRELILEKERTTPSVIKSNQGGWQSAPDFLDWGGEAVTTLQNCFSEALNFATARAGVPPSVAIEFELFAWAAVNRRGHFNTVHVQPMATWSGVYYVDAGDEPADTAGALLELAHPITAATMTFFPGVLPSARTVKPETGMIILFPSYLQHSVRMYHGERPRICVPFNAHVHRIG